MFGLRAFDTYNEALKLSPYKLALADRASLTRVSSDLVQLYVGNGKPYVKEYINSHITDETIRAGFLKLATTQNATALVVNQIATTGLVRIVWMDRETGKLDIKAQGNWERFLNDWCSTDWDTYTQTVNRRTKLLRTVVASWAWDSRRRRMVLKHYGPHQMAVGYDDGNFDKLNPDTYCFLQEEATGWDEQWHFGETATRIVNDSKKGLREEAGVFPVKDPIREETVVPFVRFATGDSGEYFEWDGQADQIDAHQLVDVCWTTANVLREYGLVVVPLLMGDGWADAEGRIKPLIFDLLRPLKQPSQGLSGQDGTKPLLQFITPSVEGLISSILGFASAQIEMTSARYGVSARAVLSKGEAASGYALQIDGASQRRQHIADVARDARPWARMADGLRWYWNHHLATEKGWEIPANVRPVAIIPKSSAVVPTREGIDGAIAQVNAGMLRPIGPIYDAEPGIDAATAFAMAERIEERVERGGELLDSMGTAGAMAPQPNAKPEFVAEPVTEEPAAMPAAPVEDVQAQVLNGAQMSSLQAIVQAVADKRLPAESAIALVVLAVPGVSQETAAALVTPAEKFVQPKEPTVADQP